MIGNQTPGLDVPAPPRAYQRRFRRVVLGKRHTGQLQRRGWSLPGACRELRRLRGKVRANIFPGWLVRSAGWGNTACRGRTASPVFFVRLPWGGLWMGSRAHGTWARLYADVWDHPKTEALARALRALGVPSRWASDVAVGQLHRLACRLADTTDDGRLGHLAPQAFGRLIGWTDHRKADAVHAAWMSSGFIDDPDTEHAKLHGFDEMFGLLVRKRDRARKDRERMTAARWPDRDDTVVTTVVPTRDTTVASMSLPKIEIEIDTPSLRSGVPPLPPPLSGGGPSPDDLADLWAELCPTMSQPDRPLAGGVRKQLTAALKREGSRDWYAAFERIGASPKLRGEEFDWQCPGILWAVGPKNLAALDSGQHDGKTNRVRSKTRTLYDGAMDALERMKSNDARQEFLPVGDDSAPDAT